MKSPIPSNEAERLRALRDYNVLDTLPEAAFDDLVHLARHICGTPAAVISFVDANRQWFKARVGVGFEETPREMAFCAHGIVHPEAIFEVPDAQADIRFADNPLVTKEPCVRFYAGARLLTPAGHPIGMLCVLDQQPRQLSPEQQAALTALGRQVISQLELRRHALELEAKEELLRQQFADLTASQWEKDRLLAESQESRRALLSLLEDQQAASNSLRESEARFRELAEHIDDVFWVTTPGADRVLYVSPAYEKVWQRSCQSVYDSPLSWVEAIHPEDRERIRHVVCDRKGEAMFDQEYRIVQPHGAIRWIRNRAYAVRDGEGNILRMIGVARDVTDRVLGMQALRDSQRLLERAQSVGQIGSWTFDLDENLFLSAEAERILGFGPGEHDHRLETFVDRVVPEDRSFILEQVRRARAGEKIAGFEYRVRRADGKTRWVYGYGDIECDESGQATRMVGVIQDITERRALEEQLRQSQKMEAIGQLAGGVAHDFNNILAAMMMQADLVDMTPNLPAEAQEFVTDLKRSAERAANLTRQLLAFSRRQVMQPRLVDLNDVITSLTKMLQRIVGEDVRVQLGMHPRPLLARVDPGMLDQVMMNLVVNARDAMPNGGKLIIESGERVFTADDLEETPDASAGRYAVVRVSDNGSGIAPEHMSRIFEPFFTTKEPGRGTGLGLATVFGIVKQHAGFLQVKSEPGKGTTFTVFLPAAETPQAAAASPASQASRRRGSETILLVEDETYVRILTRVMLERHGYHVLEAANGPQALDLWTKYEGHIDLLFTDLVMPEGMSGRELATRLLAIDPALSVVFTSGYSADIAGREFTLQAGQNFIQKPASPADLLEIVRRSLDRATT